MTSLTQSELALLLALLRSLDSSRLQTLPREFFEDLGIPRPSEQQVQQLADRLNQFEGADDV